jgi:chromosome segregation ATPase
MQLMEMNGIFETAEAVLARARAEVESLEAEVTLRQDQLRKRRRALAEREKALEQTRKAWQAAAEQEELAENELDQKLASIRAARDGRPVDDGAKNAVEAGEPSTRDENGSLEGEVVSI